MKHIRLAVDLDGAGAHPAAWRDPAARPDELFTAGYWTDAVRTAERGGLDMVTFDDAFGLQSSVLHGPDGRTDLVRGRLDTVLVACRVAAATRHIGLVPTATTTHTEPFHLASALSTLDHVSRGRAGWRPRVSWRPDEAALVGRREVPAVDPADGGSPAVAALVDDLFDEAADVVEVVRLLWDSWEDDAVIRDVASGRFVDRDKLHYVDFRGRGFSVKGPSIVPRPPQGNPVVAVLAHAAVPFRLAARVADVVFVTPRHTDDVALVVEAVRAAEAEVGRTAPPLRILADVEVVLDRTDLDASDRRELLDQLAGAEHTSDAAQFTGTPAALADLVVAWADRGIDGVRLRPAVIGLDLDAVVDGLVPELRARGRVAPGAEGGTLRRRLGLDHHPSRFATAS